MEERNQLKWRQKIWISHEKRVIFFKKVTECEALLFQKHEDLMEYVLACIESGYKVG